jgi:hypothetical protein
MGHDIGKELKPYRIEWRPDLTCGWALITQLDEHPGDLQAYVKDQPDWKWTGQWRCIAQHVTEVVGLGA